MKKEMNKPAENMLRLYDSVIYPGKCEHMRKMDRKRLRSVWAYDITYLYPVIQEGIDWMKFGLFDSKKLDRKVPFYNHQQEIFLQMAEKCAWIEQVIEYPEEIIYDEKFTLTFTPDYMIILEDGCIVMVMLMPYHLFSTQAVQKKWYALMEHCRLHGYGCVLYDIKRGISLHWLLHLWEQKDMTLFEKEIMKTLRARKSHWLDSLNMQKIMKKHQANLCDIQALVFKHKLLFIPESKSRKVALLKLHEENMFDSQLIIDAHEKNYHSSRRNNIRASSKL